METKNIREIEFVVPVTTPDVVQDELKCLHDTSNLSWRKIAAMDKYDLIPAGTLATIAKTGVVPRKWYAHFGMTAYAPAPVCAKHGVVHCFDCKTQVARPRPKSRKPRVEWRYLFGMSEAEMDSRLQLALASNSRGVCAQT